YVSTSPPVAVTSLRTDSANSSSVAPCSTRRTQLASRRRSSARCGSGSSATPKWTSASLLGLRLSISSIVRSHASRSKSGGCVGGVQGAVAGEVTDVVTCVPERGKTLQAEHVRSDNADVPWRDRGELPPERVERIAVEAARARFESARIDEMGRAYLRDVDP